MSKEKDIYEIALEECIRQFDYSDDAVWRASFKALMVEIATKIYEKNNKEAVKPSYQEIKTAFVNFKKELTIKEVSE